VTPARPPRPSRATGGGRTAKLLAATVAAWSIAGIAAARAPWHEIRLGAIEERVRGIDRPEGKTFAGALACAALLAGFRLMPGPGAAAVPAIMAAAGALALAAVGRYAWTVGGAPGRIREILREAGLEAASLGGAVPEGGLRAGAYVAALAAAAVLVASATAFWHARRRGIEWDR
jgi:hypothetical protein